MTITHLLSLLALTTSSLAVAEQQVLSSTTSEGILSRFQVNDVPRVLALAEEHRLDVWHVAESNIDIYLPAGEAELPKELVEIPRMSWPISPAPPTEYKSLVVPDWNISTGINSTFHNEYHAIEGVKSFMDQLATAFPNTTTIHEFGQTSEGRDMYAMTISSGPYQHKKFADDDDDEDDDDPDDDFGGGKKKKKKKHPKKKTPRPPIKHNEKLGFVVIGAQHAREWIGTSTALYLAHALSLPRKETQSLSKLLDHFDFHFIPVPNPDGYEYTWTSDRYWYKNRQILEPHAKCVGLDMNRLGYKWKPAPPTPRIFNKTEGVVPPTPDPCSHWFPGVRPFESPEVNDIANWVATLPNLIGFLELRSYGQMLSSPYSYSCKRIPKDAEDQTEAAIGATHALHSVHGTEFKAGSLCSTLYPAPGNMLDWMYAREGIKYSYVAHLRDTGTHGFTLPAKWIRPTGEETNHMVDYLARFIAKQTKREF